MLIGHLLFVLLMLVCDVRIEYEQQQKQRRSDMTEINTTAPMKGAIKAPEQMGSGRNE
jgi:hypothetical protein